MSTQITFTDVPENTDLQDYAAQLDQKRYEEENEKMKEEQQKLDEMTAKSNGGTEQMYRGLQQRLDPELWEKFQIICSRVRYVDPDKKNILWLHDLPHDPESQHLKDPGSKARFEKLVFVSNWQMLMYNMVHGVQYSESVVLQNAIEPVQIEEKDFDGKINIIYHTTPHRGLSILVPVYEKLYEIFGDKIHLDVYSSFGLYGWDQRDEPFKQLFDKCEEHEGITYHGYQPHDVVVEALKKAHIFAYPSIWLETSCISAIEAASAMCTVVHPNFGALSETMSHFGVDYQYNENDKEHANVFGGAMMATIEGYLDEKNHDRLKAGLKSQKAFFDTYYNWDRRAQQWTDFLKGLE
jgi:glycosyltransferase involved in cell wall biosynthesis